MKKITTFILVLFINLLSAQSAGDVAKNFGTYPGIWNNGGSVRAIALQNDGKVILGGGFFVPYNPNCIIRLNEDGTKDNSFNIGTGFDGTVHAIVIQNDGKIIVGGQFTSYNGFNANKLIRLNIDGTIDNSFNIGTGFDGLRVNALAIDTNNKILVGGYFTSYNGDTAKRIVRLNANGIKDSSFNIGTGFQLSDPGYEVDDIKIQVDSKILIGGNFTIYNGEISSKIIRLNNDGSKDNSFNIGTGFNNENPMSIHVKSIAIDNAGKILVGGNFSSFNANVSNSIIRLNSDGTKDTSFNIGVGFDGEVNSIVVQSDGKLLIGGEFSNYSGEITDKAIRLNSDGTKDINFNTGFIFDQKVEIIKLQPNGKILVAGNFSSFSGAASNRIICLNNNGSKYYAFQYGLGFDSSIYSIAMQNNGKILVGGRFTCYNGKITNKITRINETGFKDDTFNIDGTGFNHQLNITQVNSIVVQNDGKIIAGGSFSSYNGELSNNIIRLNNDGTKDNTFITNLGFNNLVKSIAIQTDGKILVGGNFTSYNGQLSKGLIRLNNDGSIDNTFNNVINNNNSASIDVIVIQNDGKILIGGWIGTGNVLVRLNNDGTIDNTFTIGTGNSRVSTIAIQTDGKILLGGNFTSYNNQQFNRVIRLNNNGTIDNSFSIGSGFNFYVYSIHLQIDGKILVGGEFTLYNLVPSSKIIRLNSNGTKDITFNIGAGFNGAVNSIVLNNNNILVGGIFTSYKDIYDSVFLIALHLVTSLDTISFNTSNAFKLYPNPTTSILNFKSVVAVETIAIYNMLGQLVQQEKVNALEGAINIEKLAQGNYLVKVNDIAKGYTIIKN
jgi:uncharacterized delta-60 repeat protein